MEKKKMKIWKKILIILGIIIIVLLIYIFRNFIILNILNKNVEKQIENTNVYVKLENESTIAEKYRKGDTVKLVIQRKGTDIKITQITSRKQRLVYTESGDIKEMHKYQDEENSFFETNQNVILKAADYIAFSEMIGNCFSFITTEILDGKECYVLNGLNNCNFLYNANAINHKVYVEKETGLTYKIIEKIDEDGNIREIVTTYEYKFDTVTDDDIKELDNTEYKLVE